MATTRLLKISPPLKFLLRSSVIRKAHLPAVSYSQTLLNIPETVVTTLDNGLKVATEYSDSTAATVGVWIDAGSRYETSSNNGVAHFLEHMTYRGTNQRSQKDFESQVLNMGAQISSYTDREETAFYARCLASDVPKAVDILADMITNTKLDEQDIEKERSVILDQLKEAENDLKLVTMDYLHLTAYQGTELAPSVLGPSENIKKISKNDLAFYGRNNFIAPRMALVGSGDIKHDDLVKLAEKHFSSVPYTYTTEIPVIKPCRYTGSEVRARDDWLPFAHVAVAVDTCGHNSPDIYPLMLAKTIIGSWDQTLGSSENTMNRLIQNIHKEKRCHSYESFHTLYRDSGLWGIYFVMDKMVLDDFMFNLQNEWMRLCISITETELQAAKATLRSHLFETSDGTTANCAEIGRQVLHYGERTSLAEVDEQLQSVTLEKLKDICSKYIYDRCPVVSAVGPIEAMPDYNRVRSNMYWLRF